jgi:hypothetical protein
MQPDPALNAAASRWLNDGTRRIPELGDGDPREYGGTLPDGRRWSHPPYGPSRVDPPSPFLRAAGFTAWLSRWPRPLRLAWFSAICACVIVAAAEVVRIALAGQPTALRVAAVAVVIAAGMSVAIRLVAAVDARLGGRRSR